MLGLLALGTAAAGGQLVARLHRSRPLVPSVAPIRSTLIDMGPLANPSRFSACKLESRDSLRSNSLTRPCSICIARSRGTVGLEIINDGAMPVTPGGSGLNGLAARAAVLSGTANGRSSGDGRFQLTVEVPEMAP